MNQAVMVSNNLAIQILHILFTYRRSLADAHEYRHYCEQCHHPHLDKILKFIADNKPIHMVLPGFPAKSPNMNKVLGNLPDKGEQLALSFLNNICESIQSLYPPGAKITICSDGHVFADLVQVSDEQVDSYNKEIDNIIKQGKLKNLDMFGLWNIFGDAHNETKLQNFIAGYTLSSNEIKQLIKNTPRELSLFNGIEKFLLEDFLYLEPTKSKNAIRKRVHDLTYRVIQRSHGWSKVVEDHFPHAIRLSIHPQPCHYNKLGIYLVETRNNWLTPWHGVAVLKNGKFELMKKYDALSNSSKIVMEFGRPSYIHQP